MDRIIDRTSEYTSLEAYKGRERGLYLMLVHNPSPLAIYDRNRDGKLLVDPEAWMVKGGKFEGGLKARMHLNYVHLHRRLANDAEEANIFPEVLRLLLVHFMPDADPRQLRTRETELNRKLRRLLEDLGRHDPEQRGHSESRRISGQPPSEAQLRELFEGVIVQA